MYLGRYVVGRARGRINSIEGRYGLRTSVKQQHQQQQIPLQKRGREAVVFVPTFVVHDHYTVYYIHDIVM